MPQTFKHGHRPEAVGGRVECGEWRGVDKQAPAGIAGKVSCTLTFMSGIRARCK